MNNEIKKLEYIEIILAFSCKIQLILVNLLYFSKKNNKIDML